MKSVMGEETQNAREDVFNDYLIYYQQVWPQGNLSICQETEVTEKARRFLRTESNPDSRFTVFDFYQTVLKCLTEGRRECQDVLKELVKATEVLEMLCVNLFLFPWKKEIKTLKTFTGPFVYWVKQVLPQTVLTGILESIGYQPKTDMEYRLDKSADTGKASRMGFELFLARQECEYLLEVMGQNQPWECLEILQQRSPQTPQSLCERVQEDKGEECTSAGSANALLPNNGEEDLDRGHSLVDPGAVLSEECQTLPGSAGGGDEDPGQYPQILEFQGPEETVEPGGGQSCAFVTDDRSLLEMQEHYPDLAFRKKLIFREPQGQPAGPSKQKAPKGVAPAGSDLSAPSSTARLSESRPATSVTAASQKLTRCPPVPPALEKEPVEPETHHAQTPALLQGTGSRGAQTMPENSQASGDDVLVSELAKKMSSMYTKDYRADIDLKYPVEETAWQDDRKAPPLGSPRDGSQPIMCQLPQVQHSSISGCHACERLNVPRGDSSGCDTIKEPPQSFYIPPKAVCAPPSSRGHVLQQEDDVENTYVVVDHDQI